MNPVASEMAEVNEYLYRNEQTQSMKELLSSINKEVYELRDLLTVQAKELSSLKRKVERIMAVS